MDLESKKITVIGAGRSGIGAAKLVKRVGGIPFVSDAGNENNLSESIDVLNESGIKYETSAHSEKVYDCETMVVSPGVPVTAAVLIIARERNAQQGSTDGVRKGIYPVVIPRRDRRVSS